MIRISKAVATLVHFTRRTPIRRFAQRVVAQPQVINGLYSNVEKMTDGDFRSRVDQTFASINAGLADMQETNREAKRTFDIEHTAHSFNIVLDNDIGTFMFTLEPHTQKLCLQSPESGVHKYVWETVNERWISDSDQHQLVELLMRDLMKHCMGVPNL